MERIESFFQLDSIICAYKAGRKGIYTNCFLLKNEIDKLISEARLYFDDCTNMLQIICDEDIYYHLYFYGSLEDEFLFSEYDKPILCDMVCTVAMREKDKIAQKKIEESGFKLHAENRQFVISASEQKRRAEAELNKLIKKMEAEGYDLVVANKEDFTSIYKLWRQNLDTYAFKYVGENEWEKAFLEKQIHCIKNRDGNICAARWYECINKNSWEHHITVKKEYRGMGFAQILLSQQIVIAGSEGYSHVLCWIEKNNESSLKLHSMWGDFNNKVLKQYVKCNFALKI